MMHNSGGKLTVSYSNLRKKGVELKAGGKLREAADTYQKMFDQDPKDLVTMRQLLILYRKLKEYRKELTVINAVLAAQESYVKERQGEWMTGHPRAAKAARSLLKSLEAKGEKVHDDPQVAALKKRKEMVKKKMKA
jgi:tetratricopeptide (TPR) repeat protein